MGPSALSTLAGDGDDVAMPLIDPATALIGLLAVAVAIGAAVFAGTASARIFFDASREPDEE